MPEPKRDQVIRILRQTDVGKDVTAFVVDGQARGLSTRTVEFHADERRYLRVYLESRSVQHVQDVTPSLLPEYLLHLGKRRNAGGVHAAYRAMRAFLNWYKTEYEPQGWANPIRKVRRPRVPQQQDKILRYRPC